MQTKQLYFYDLEVLKNCFIAVFRQSRSDYHSFVFHADFPESRNKGEFSRLKSFTRSLQRESQCGESLVVGYNNLGYDDTVLFKFLESRGSIKTARATSDEIIGSPWGSRKDFSMFANSIDLLSIWDKGKLKEFQARLGMDVDEFVHDFDKDLPVDEIETCLKYCMKDVVTCEELYHRPETLDRIDQKTKLASKYRLRRGANYRYVDLAREIFRIELGADRYRKTSPKYDFRVGDLLDPRIAFQDKALQAQLNDLKNFESKFKFSANGRLIQEKHFPVKKFSIGSKTYTIGSGGVHNEKNECKGLYKDLQGYRLVNCDVKSQHPTIVENLQVAPSEYPKFHEIMSKLKADRFAAIESGDTTTARALKEVINSSCGLLKSGYSPDKTPFLFEPTEHLRITLNAQFSMLVLVERLASYSEVIQVNTDNVFVLVRDQDFDKFESVVDGWMVEYNCDVHLREFDAAIYKTVNSFAWYRDGQQVVGKDYFRTKPSLYYNFGKPPVIARAIAQYILHSTPVSETIASADLQEFLYWYVPTVNGRKQVMRLAVAKQGRGEAIKGIISFGSGRVVVANKLDQINPADVDREFYVEIAESLLTECEGCESETGSDQKTAVSKSSAPVKQSTEIKSDPQQGRALMLLLSDDRHYFHTIGGNVKQRKLIQYNTVDHQNFTDSYICLNPFKESSKKRDASNVISRECITIEYDDENLTLADQFEMLSKVPHTVICWSGNKSLHCHIRFSEALDEKENDLLEKYMAQLFGDSDTSVWRINNYVRLPGGFNPKTKQVQDIRSIGSRVNKKKFFEFLEQERAKAGKDLKLVQDRIFRPATTDQGVFKNVISEVLQGVEVKYQTITEIRSRKKVILGPHDKDTASNKIPASLQAFCNCPNAHMHSKQSADPSKDYSIVLLGNGTVIANCWHHSCREANKTVEKSINEKFQEGSAKVKGKKDGVVETIVSPETDDQPPVDAKRIAKALRSPSKFKILECQPGAGKSYESVKLALEMIAKGEPVLFVGCNKADLDQIEKYFCELADVDSIDAIEGQKMQAEVFGDSEDGSTKSNSYPMKGAKFIITHKHYLRRKGVGITFYPILEWIRTRRPHIFIDEYTDYLLGLQQIIPLEGRAKKFQRDGASQAKFRRSNQCPSKRLNAFRCESCYLHTQRHFGVDDFNNPTVRLEYELFESEYKAKSVEDTDYYSDLGPPIDCTDLNFKLREIKTDESFLKKKQDFLEKYPEGVFFDKQGLEGLRDLVHSSRNPRIMTVYKSFQGTEISTEACQSLSKEEKAKLVYPTLACGKYLCVWDKAVPTFLGRHARSVTFLGITSLEGSKEYLEECFEDTVVVQKIDTARERKQRVLLLGFSKEIADSKFPIDNTMVSFHRNVAQAETQRKKYADPRVGLWKDGDCYVAGKVACKGYRHVLSSSYSAIGKAINLDEEFEIVKVNSQPYKPFFTFAANENPESIRIANERHRFEMIRQNAGRVLRGKDQAKVVIITDISSVDFDELEKVMGLKKTCKLSRKIYYEVDGDKVIESAVNFLKHGDVKKQREYNKEKVQAAAKKQSQTKRKKNGTKHTRLDFDEKVEKAIRFANEGIAFTEVLAKLSVYYESKKDSGYRERFTVAVAKGLHNATDANFSEILQYLRLTKDDEEYRQRVIAAVFAPKEDRKEAQ